LLITTICVEQQTHIQIDAVAIPKCDHQFLFV